MYLIFDFFLKILNLPIRYIAHFIFLILMMVCYLRDNLNLYSNKSKYLNIVYSVITNVIVFGISFIFEKTNKFIYIGIIYTISENIIAEIFISKFNKKNKILVYGCGIENLKIKKIISKNKNLEYLGFLSEKSKDGKLGELKDIYKICVENEVNEIIILESIKKQIEPDIIKLKIEGTKILSYGDFLERIAGRIDILKLDNDWIIKSKGFEILNNNFERRIKRIVDLIAATIITCISLPIMVISSIILKLESKGPIIFKQDRVGFNGEIFKIYKFRSMRLHDENKYSKYAQEKDNRITKFGNFMRKTRIDELPQLWNVFNGTMSFVGPRAEWDKLHSEYIKEIPFYYLRSSVKPGLTGWAQVMYPYGANIQDTVNKLEYDIYYIKYQNFTFDIIIIIKTIKVVLFGMGR